MLFKKLVGLVVRGNLRLWLDGNLPRNLRQIWHQQHGWGSDPLYRSILTHTGFTVVIISLLFFFMTPIGVAIDGEIVKARLGIAPLVSVFVAIFAFLFAMYHLDDGAKFYEALLCAQKYMGLSLEDITALNREGLQYHARKCLENSGKNLRAAELKLPPYHPEREKLRTDFEKRYATFLTLGMIKNVGYGSFIPAILPMT
ncbi:MAG: hypothetical protein PHR36_01640 [Patescibacteria group bacterium]|nr:hypothetical protein [Patescibacteria group bacterium]